MGRIHNYKTLSQLAKKNFVQEEFNAFLKNESDGSNFTRELQVMPMLLTKSNKLRMMYKDISRYC